MRDNNSGKDRFNRLNLIYGSFFREVNEWLRWGQENWSDKLYFAIQTEIFLVWQSFYHWIWIVDFQSLWSVSMRNANGFTGEYKKIVYLVTSDLMEMPIALCLCLKKTQVILIELYRMHFHQHSLVAGCDLVLLYPQQWSKQLQMKWRVRPSNCLKYLAT